MKKADTSIGGSRFGQPFIICNRCGKRYDVAVPISINAMCGLVEGFNRDHVHCPKLDAEKETKI
jgi:hypothetical protein